MGPLIGNCPNQVNKNMIICAKVSQNMICYLILVSNLAEKFLTNDFKTPPQKVITTTIDKL